MFPIDQLKNHPFGPVQYHHQDDGSELKLS